MPRRLARNSPQPIGSASDSAQFRERISNVGPPDFSSSSTEPSGLDAMMNEIARKSIQITSIHALQLILGLMYLNESLTEYPQIFRVFFHHLRSTPPVQCATEADQLKAQVGAISFCGIYLIHEALYRKLMKDPNSNNPLLAHTLTNSWPDLWKWIEYLHKVDVAVFSSLSHTITVVGLRRMILRTLGSSCLDLGPPDFFGDAMKETPGVFVMLVEMWAKVSEVEVADEKNQTSVTDSSLALTAIYNLITSDPTKALVFVQLLGNDIDRIAALMLNNLREAFDTILRKKAIDRFCRVLHLSNIIANFVPRLRHTLLSQNSMVIVTRTFGKLSSIRAHVYGSSSDVGTSPEDIQLASELALIGVFSDVQGSTAVFLLYFEDASKTSGGFTWVIQAIRSGMIPAILRSACRGSEEIEHQRLINCVTKILQPYLVYRSVLRAVSKAVQGSIVKDLESHLPQNEKFGKVWANFKELVRLRLAAKVQFDAGGEYPQRCSSAQCNKVEGDESFRLCSNCQDTCYCSQECQRNDWKHEGHREACALLRKDRADGVSPPISSRDLAFLHFLAIGNVLACRGNILEILNKKFLRNHVQPRSFIIHVNLSTHPPYFSVLPNNKPKYRLYEPTARHYSRTSSAVVLGVPSPSLIVNIHAAVPYGKENVVIPCTSDTVNSLFRLQENTPQLPRPAGYLEMAALNLEQQLVLQGNVW